MRGVSIKHFAETAANISEGIISEPGMGSPHSYSFEKIIEDNLELVLRIPSCERKFLPENTDKSTV